MLKFGGKISFLLLHRKGLQTTANIHQYNSVNRKHTLKTVLIGSSVFLLEPDISQYCMYSDSLGNIKMHLPEQTLF